MVAHSVDALRGKWGSGSLPLQIGYIRILADTLKGYGEPSARHTPSLACAASSMPGCRRNG
jgi:hypothetical protein